MRRRGGVAAGVLVAWVAGLALFAKREVSEAPARRLAEAALRVSPGAAFYRVEQDGRQIGFASSTIDTTRTGLQVTDFLSAQLPVGGREHLATATSEVHLTRTLGLSRFRVSFESDSAPITVSGRAVGDSVLEVSIAHEEPAADTQRVPLSGPLVLPTIVPLAVALGERPAVGKTYTFSAFDPVAMAPRPLTVRVDAESVFAVTDSARFDEGRRRWMTARRDSVRAWRLVTDGASSGVRAWVDEQGRLVELHHSLGFTLRRTAYEIAFENWRLDGGTRTRRISADRDVLETTAIAASAPIERKRPSLLRVRLRGAALRGFALAGGRQSLQVDTLTVERERAPLQADYSLPLPMVKRRPLRRFLAPEPLIQSADTGILALARRLRSDSRDPVVVAQRINEWVHDSLAKVVAITVPSAKQVLKARAGDCNEHTQLYVALARAAGIPARAAAGLAWVGGKFYYHAWPEVFLGRWVAVDPTFGQFPADAAHLRFVYGGLARQTDLIRLMGTLRIDVLASE